MEHVLAGLCWMSCLVYHHDIIMHRSVEEHLRLLCEVFTSLRKAGLNIKVSKVICSRPVFVAYTVSHMVSAKGVEIDTEKMAEKNGVPWYTAL